MALRLIDNSVFLHIPKTGGSFICQYLRNQHLIKENCAGQHDDLFRCLYPQDWPTRASRVIKEFIPKLKGRLHIKKEQHDWKKGPQPHQPNSESLPYMFCFVRNPISWVESYYHYCVKQEWYYWSSEYDYGGFWHPNAVLNTLKSNSLNQFVEKLLLKRPGYVTEMYGWYTTPGIRFIGKTESLRDDLAKVLRLRNLSFDTGELKTATKVNVSQSCSTDNNWDENLLKEFVLSEYSCFKRFGYKIPFNINI